MNITPSNIQNTYFNHPKVKEFSYIGNLDLLSLPKICIIGSRKMSQYGKMVVENFINNIGGLNLSTVSGFVEGVDFEVFNQCVKKGVPTIAVLGYGFDFLDKNLLKKAGDLDFSKILFISEFTNDTAPKIYTFPVRDETLAYISNIIFVVEAAEKSGTFYTVKRAFKENKKVFAAAGSIFNPLCKGNFKLLKSGFGKQKAILYSSPGDILECFNLNLSTVSESISNLTESELKIVNIIASQEIHFDDLSKIIKIDVSKLSVILSDLEIRGIIINKNGYYYKNI